jgi:transcription initiation factor TFIID subunit 2
MEAALALILVSSACDCERTKTDANLLQCATKAQNYLGLFHLFLLFQTRYCFEPEVDTRDPFGFRCIPKTNDFRDLTEYFLKKVSSSPSESIHDADGVLQTLLTAISKVRDDQGQTPPVVQQFLVDLLAYNDNLGNPVRLVPFPFDGIQLTVPPVL